MARPAAITLLALVSAIVAAETTVIDVVVPAPNLPRAVFASVVAADASLTTLAAACPKEKLDPSICGLEGTATFIQGPSTLDATIHYTTAPAGPFMQNIDCKLDRVKDMGDCNFFVSGQLAGTFVFTSTTFRPMDLAKYIVPCTITAGAEKLPNAVTTTTSTDSKSAPTETSSTQTSSAAVTTNRGSTTSNAKSTPTSNSGNVGAMVTQNALLAGAAALVGGIVALYMA